MRTFFHVTPWDIWSKSISKDGLKPLAKKRGVYADDKKQGRIFLFEDRATADDAMENWLVDEFPNVRYFAMLSVSIPESKEVYDDPEIAGSFFVVDGVPSDDIKFVEKIDVGESDD